MSNIDEKALNKAVQCYMEYPPRAVIREMIQAIIEAYEQAKSAEQPVECSDKQAVEKAIEEVVKVIRPKLHTALSEQAAAGYIPCAQIDIQTDLKLLDMRMYLLMAIEAYKYLAPKQPDDCSEWKQDWSHMKDKKPQEEESAGEFLQRLGMDGNKWAEEMHKRFPAIAQDDLLGWCCNMIMAGYDEAVRRANKREYSKDYVLGRTTLSTPFGAIKLEINPSVPKDEAWFIDKDGKLVGKITQIEGGGSSEYSAEIEK